jgi:hypothetical protein
MAKIKPLIIALTLIMTTAAMAQMLMPTQLPTTLPLIDNNTKETIGTATLWGGKMVLRKTNGEFIATVVFEPNGTRTMYDENGKILDQLPSKITIPKLPQADK